MSMNEKFRKFAAKIAAIAGNPWAFIIALLIIATWAMLGPTFGFSNTWQLFINTGTTIVTLLMVFLIQNTQNRDSRAIHLKLDELLKGVKGASNKLVNIEEDSDAVLEELHQQFRDLQSKYSKITSEKEGKSSHVGDIINQLIDTVSKPLKPQK